MSRKFKIRNQEKLYHITFTIIHWLDVFIRREYRDLFLESVKYCQVNKGLEVYAYCIMSSHVNMIIGRNGEENLEGIIRDLKKFTLVKLIEAIAANPQESRKELLLGLFERAGRKNSNNTKYQFWLQQLNLMILNTCVRVRPWVSRLPGLVIHLFKRPNQLIRLSNIQLIIFNLILNGADLLLIRYKTLKHIINLVQAWSGI